MSKRTKRRIETFSFYDHTGIVRHLTQMAEKGWLLESIQQFSWVYRRITPQKLHFSVTYYPAASEFDPGPSEEQLVYHDYSARAGWTYLCSWAQMQIFYSADENPIPIQTEPLMEVQELHHAIKRVFLPSAFLMIGLALIQTVLLILRLLADPIGLLASSTALGSGSCWVLLFLYYGVDVACYYLWRHRALQAAQCGNFLETPNTLTFQRVCLAAALAEIFYIFVSTISAGDRLMTAIYAFTLTSILFVIAVMNGIKAFLKRRKASAKINFKVTMAVSFVLYLILQGGITNMMLNETFFGQFPKQTGFLYQESLPLAVEDLQEVTYTGYVREQRSSESPFLGQLIVRQWHGFDSPAAKNIPELRYTVTIVKIPALYATCKQSLLGKHTDDILDHGTVRVDHYEAIDATPWLAEEAYQLHWEESIRFHYLLCYPDRIIELDFDWEPTPEQMRITAGKLT